MVKQEFQVEAVGLLMLLRVILYTRYELITIKLNNSAVRAVTALYYCLYTWPSIGTGFQIIFPPAAT